MNAVRPPECAPRTSRDDRGFTLIELMIAIVLSLMIGGVIVGALITSLNAARSTSAQMSDSTDAGLISSFLVRDAQSAGGIDPGTAMRDPTLGVSNLASPADWDGCAQSGGVFVLRFSWMDRTTAATSVVTYAGVPDPFDGTKQQLIRRLCTNGTQTDVVLGRNINSNPLSTFATCQNPDLSSGCGSQSTSVTLTLTGKNTPTPLVSILTASLRSGASQLTIIGPSAMPAGQVGAQYPSVVLTTIGAAAVTATGTPVDPKWVATGVPGLSIALSSDKSAGVLSGKPTAMGKFQLTITVTDALGAKASKVYTVDVHAPPIAVADNYTVNEDTTLTRDALTGVLSNGDNSPEGKPITAILYSGVANGALTLNPDGSFTYIPRANFNGPDSFRYKANDGSLSSSIVTVTLTVTAVNDAPVNKVPVRQETPKNTNEVFAGAGNVISISDIDAGSSAVQVQLVSTSGTVSLSGVAGLAFTAGDGISDTTMTFTGTITAINTALAGSSFTPANNFIGLATLQITTNDLGHSGSPGALTDTDSVTIKVTSLGIFSANGNVGELGKLPQSPPSSQLTAGATSSYSPSTYTVAGGGRDIWDTSDGFQFIDRTMPNEPSLPSDVSLTARVVSETVTYDGSSQSAKQCFDAGGLQQPCESVAKAGVMFRQDLSVGSAEAFVGVTKGKGSEFTYRTTAGTVAGATGAADALGVPYWVRLIRNGNLITAQTSPDGTTWTARGVSQTIPFGSTIYVGLAVSAVNQLSQDDPGKKLNTAVFDNVSISTPPVAVADSYSVGENSTLPVLAASGVLANDSDPEGNTLTAALVTGTTGLTLNQDGSFTYVPPAGFAGTASFTYSANDGVFATAATVTITVNAANATPSFSEGANQLTSPSAGAQLIAGWATAITAGAGEDSTQLVDFIVTNNNTSLFSDQPAVSADGTLTFTPAGGVSGVATVSINIHDNGGTTYGASDSSAVQTFTITIDDPPVVTATGTSLAYTENATTALDPGVTVTDPDSANLASATVTMTANYVNGQDTLAFATQNGISGVWSPLTGVLTLSGNATVANYQTALQSITYNNTSDNPSSATRTVTFVANDGAIVSNTASRTITVTAVNDAPVVVPTGTSLGYIENATTPVDSALTVTDIDSANLASATVSMTTGYINGQDVLAFTNQNGITGSWNGATGVWTLSGNTTPANYQTALRSITYNNTSDAPNTTARTVTFVVNDGAAASTMASRTINVTPVNDAPVGTAKTVTFNQDTPYTFTANDFGFTDPSDSPPNTLFAVKISQLPTVGALKLNNVAVTLNQVIPVGSITSLVFTPALNGNGATYASLNFRVQDNGGTANGGVDLDVSQRTLTFSVTDNVAPTVTNVSSTLVNGSYTTGQVIPVTVAFSEVVNVTGTPRLTLNTGTVVNYSSGSGSNTLIFNYTVAAGNTSADLDYAATTSLALNGGTIRDLATNAATLTLPSPGASGSLGFNRNLVVDTTAPSGAIVVPVASAIVRGASVAVSSNSADAGSGVASADFQRSPAGAGTWVTITSVAIAPFSTTWNTTSVADGLYDLRVVTTDNAGNTFTSAAVSNVRVDNTAPSGTGLSTTNVTAGVVGKLELGDTFTLTYSEAVLPTSISGGWNGSTTVNVVVRTTNNNPVTGGNDSLAIYDATNTTLLPLGILNLGRTDFVNSSPTFGASVTASTMTMSGSSVTVKLGKNSGTSQTAAGSGTVVWTPAIGATDLAGNPASTAPFTETGALDKDF